MSSIPVGVRPKGTYAIVFKDSSLTKTEFRDDVDINRIIAKYLQTGEVPDAISNAEPLFADVSQLPDYRTAFNSIQDANARFAALPAKARDFFRNDPARFIAFASDPKNGAMMVKLGLATVRKVDPVPSDGPIVTRKGDSSKAPATPE